MQETVDILIVAVLTVTIEVLIAVGIGAHHPTEIISLTLDHIILVAILALARDLSLLFEMYRLVLLTDMTAVNPARLRLALFRATFAKVGVTNPLMVAPRNLNPSSYVCSLVAKFRLDPDSRSSARTVPLSKSDWLTAVDADHSLAAPLPPHLPYRSLLGGILYANVCSRPDVSFAVSALASHNSDPKQMHWNALINLLKFMRDTQNLSITYGSSISYDDINELRVYADADFSRHPERRRSRSGHVIYFNGGAICWKSSLQKRISTSTSESELFSLYDATKMASWFRHLLGELGFTPPCFEDNRGVVD